MESINNSKNIIIYNTIRRLGLRPNHRGTIFIVKAVWLIRKNPDIIVIKDIYMEIAKTSNAFTLEQIRVAIKYAIDHRNEQKAFRILKRFLVTNTMKKCLRIKTFWRT